MRGRIKSLSYFMHPVFLSGLMLNYSGKTDWWLNVPLIETKLMLWFSLTPAFACRNLRNDKRRWDTPNLRFSHKF